jgi:predicted RecA/RadA family phage recombinase
MQNFVHKGDVLPLTAPATVLSGAGALIGGTIFGVACADYTSGDIHAEFAVTGVFDLAKVSLQSWSVGNIIFWDNSAKLATTVASGNVKIGVATKVAANPSSTGRVRLNGTPGADFGSA